MSSPALSIDMTHAGVPNRYPFLALILVWVSLISATFDLPGPIRHVVSMGTPSLAIGTFIHIVISLFCIAAFAVCAIVEVLGSSKRMWAVSLALLPIVVLSVFGAVGAFIDLLNGNFVQALRSTPSATLSLVLIPAIWVYFVLAARRHLAQ